MNRCNPPEVEAERRVDASTEPVPEAERDAVIAAATEGLRKQAEFTGQLGAAYESLIEDALIDLHEKQVQIARLVDQYLDFFQQNILWIQNARPIDFGHLSATGRSVLWLFGPSQWKPVVKAAGKAAADRPAGVVGWVLLIALLIALRRPARRQLDDVAARIKRAATDGFGNTFRAFIITIVLSLPWPVVLWGLSRMLVASEAQAEFVVACMHALQWCAKVLFCLELIRNLCRPRGLGEAHLQWRANDLALVRRHLRWLTLVVVPSIFVVSLTDGQATLVQHESLGRLMFCVATLALSVFAWLVLHPDRGVLQRFIARHQGGWVDRLRGLWFPLLIAIGPALVVTACIGYFLTARELERHVVASAMIVIGGIVLYRMCMRWLQVAQRRLALEQVRQRIAAAREAAKESQESSSEQSIVPEDVELDAAAMNQQTRRLVTSGTLILVALALFGVWAGVLPALSKLEQIVLWLPGGVTETVAADGSVVVPAAAVTLADVGRALVVIFITFVVARNIPGVLEIAVLQRLPLSAGVRYTWRTLVRYALLIIGIILTFDAIGIGWSKVQWLAAAVSVGLGFGLQEIFANFVSGLIILTERPVRVGDTVTIGTTSGTVSRIQMRATTVTDWERKELIIPNKQFVTGEIVNWTLSNAVLRIVIPVGIAYGSDTALAKKLMLEAADAEPSVLKDPPPRCFFMAFGASSLDFDLRIFIEDVDNFSAIRDRVITAIDNTFREHDIEIAFPQQDLHVRSIEPTLVVQQDGKTRELTLPESAGTPVEKLS